jgi:hypothetical protein
MKKYTLVLIVLSFFAFDAIGQELNCTVSLSNTGQVKNRTEEIYNNMRTAIEDFMNSTVWTADKFGAIEKIDCSIAINVTEETGTNSYTAEAVIQSSRPVFNSSYSTTIFYMKDADFSFSYADGEPLIFNEGAYTSKITSMLAFYAYLILGMDYDSFQKFGGNDYYTKAIDVANNAGWADAGEYSRYSIIKLIQRPDHEIFRKFLYEYHRLGLDAMYSNMSKAQNKINGTFRHLDKFLKDVPGSNWLNILFNCKRNEFANIIKKLSPEKKEATIKLLNGLDINNRGVYNKVKK